jgi:hypothetical protein
VLLYLDPEALQGRPYSERPTTGVVGQVVFIGGEGVQVEA